MLPEEALKKIYGENFRHHMPRRRDVDPDALRAFAAEMMPYIRDEGVKRLITGNS